MILSPAPHTPHVVCVPGSGIPTLITNEWHPEVIESLADSPFPSSPEIYTSIAQLEAALSYYPKGTIVFAPALGTTPPQHIRDHFRIFCNCPRTKDMYVLPYSIPFDREPTQHGNARSRWLSFIGSLRANTWRIAMFNTNWNYPTYFRIIPTYFHACDEPTVVFEYSSHYESGHLIVPSYTYARMSSKAELAADYWKELESYEFILCPIGDHHGSQRLIEAAYAGAFPILIGDPLMTSVPACIRDLVLSFPARIDIEDVVTAYEIPEALLYRSDDLTVIEQGVSPAWVYNPDQRATLSLPAPIGTLLEAHKAKLAPEPYEEGEHCIECSTGTAQLFPAEGCRCHISPPCNACDTNRPRCDTCGSEEKPADAFSRTRLLHPRNLGEYIAYELLHRNP